MSAKLSVIILMNTKMGTDRYESPRTEILIIEVEQAILSTSFTGEGINDWEDM